MSKVADGHRPAGGLASHVGLTNPHPQREISRLPPPPPLKFAHPRSGTQGGGNYSQYYQVFSNPREPWRDLHGHLMVNLWVGSASKSFSTTKAWGRSYQPTRASPAGRGLGLTLYVSCRVVDPTRWLPALGAGSLPQASQSLPPPITLPDLFGDSEKLCWRSKGGSGPKKMAL